MTLTKSHDTLKLLAASVWYIGSVVLLIKGRSLLMEAHDIQTSLLWPGLVVVASIFLGFMKAKFIFSKSCRKNILRIETLAQPKLWQFFRPVFFLALALMILTGAILSRLASGHYMGLHGVALLDLTIGIALLTSSIEFWQPKSSIQPTPQK